MELDQYIIPRNGLDLNRLLEDWRWLLPKAHTVLMINRFAEFLIEDQAGIIHNLETGTGVLREIAKGRAELADAFDDEERAADLLMAGLTDACVAAGMTLLPGQCYQFKIPPSLGGTYELSNFDAGSMRVYLSLMGQLHEQIKDLPDGTPIGSVTIDGVPIATKR